MQKEYPGLPPPCNTPSYPPGGDEAAELEAAPTIPSGPAQSADHELVLTICDLVSNPRGSWSGTAGELLNAANAENRLIGIVPEQVAHDVANLEDLFEFHQIQHFVLEINPNESVRHIFLLRE